MTVKQKNYLKSNWITFANLVLLIGILVQQAKWQQNVDNKLSQFEAHVHDSEMHMPFKDKIEVFMPRIELDARFHNIQQSLKRIEDKLN